MSVIVILLLVFLFDWCSHLTLSIGTPIPFYRSKDWMLQLEVNNSTFTLLKFQFRFMKAISSKPGIFSIFHSSGESSLSPVMHNEQLSAQSLGCSLIFNPIPYWRNMLPGLGDYNNSLWHSFLTIFFSTFTASIFFCFNTDLLGPEIRVGACIYWAISA